MKKDPPANLLPYYLEEHLNQDAGDLEYWLGISQRNDAPCLELGCGTGRLLIPIAETGKMVWGIDHDREMLAYLIENLPVDTAPRVHVLQAAMSAFHFDIHFGTILLPCNTFSTLSSKERIPTLNHVRRHLENRGIFAVSVPNPVRLLELARKGKPEFEGFFPHPVDKNPVHIFSTWEKNAATVTMYWHYDHLHKDGSVQRTSTSTRHFLTPKNTYINELQDSGFTEVMLYGDYDHSEYEQESPYLILEAQK